MSRLSPRPSSTARTGIAAAGPVGSAVAASTSMIARHLRKDTGIRILDTPDQLEDLRDGWQRLRADVPGPNAELDHLVAHLRTLPPNLRAHVITVHDDLGVSGVAPLVRSEGSVPARLTFTETDANGFLYADDEQRDRLIDAVLGQRLPLELESLVAGSATLAALRERAGPGWFRRETPRLGGPSLPIDASWIDPAAKLSKGRQADLRRTLRRAQELGEVSLEAEVPRDELERDFEELVRLEAQSWKYDAGTALACDARQREALRRYLTAPQVRDRVLVTRMRIGDALIALDVSVMIGDRLWGIKGGVDERYRPCAAGLHLKALAIGEAAARGFDRYEFMGATAPYKEMWGAGPVALQRVQLYPPSVDGQTALASDAAHKARRALARAVRGPLGAESDTAAPPESATSTTTKARMTEQTPADATSATSERVAARAALRHPGRHLRSGRDRTVCVVEDAASLEELRSSWQQLRADTAGPSSELDWLLAHARWRTDEQLCVVTVHHRGELTGAAPLFRSRSRAPRLRLAVLDATGFLYRDEAELTRLVDAVLALPLPLSLDLMIGGAPTERVVQRRLPRGRFVVRSTRDAGPSVALDPSWQDPLSKLSGRRRNDLRRKLRKAEQAGPVEFAVHAPGDDLDEHFRRFVEVEGSEWKRRAGTALADDDARREELWRYLDTDAVRDHVRFATFRIGERIVAADLAVLRGGRYWFYKGGYDPAYAKLSPGQLLKVHTLAWAADQGLERYEFMGDCEPYKAAWGDCTQLVSLRVYGPNAPSAAAFSTDAFRKLVRVTKRSLAESPGRDRGTAQRDAAPHDVAQPSQATGSKAPAPATRDLPMVRTVTDLGRWRTAWDRLVDAAPLPSPFLRSWWLEHADHGAPRFVLVTDGDDLIGGMALQEDRVLSLPCYRVLGHGGLVPDHLDALAAPDRRGDVEVALRSWCERPGTRIFDLEGIVDGSLFARVLPGSVTSETIEEARFRNLPDDPAQLVPGMSGTERSAVKRGRKKLERAGAEHRIVPAGEVDAALGDLRRLHHLRWGDRSGFLGQFDSFAASVRDAIERDEAMLHELTLHGRVICVLVEFHLAGRAFSFQDGRDPDPSLPSPGSVLQAYAMEHAIRLGRREYDFLRGSFSYKSSWTDDARPILRVRASQGRTAEVALRLVRLREHAAETKGRLRRRAVERIGDGTRAVEQARRRLLQRRLARVGDGPGDRTVQVLEDPKDLEALRDGWRALDADAPGPNSELDWALSYAANLRDHERLRVVTVHDDDTCVAIAPLVEQRRGGGRLELIDNEVCGFLYRDTDALTRLVDAVLALRIPLALRTLPAGSPTERILRARAGRTSIVRVAEDTAGPSLPLDPSWSEPLSQLSSSRRRDVKRRLRRAEERGNVELAVHAPGERVGAAFEEYARVEGQSWKQREGTALSGSTWERDLLGRYLRSPNVQDRVRLTTLRIDGRVIAADLGVLTRGRYWAMKSSYVEDEAELGPGILTKVHTIGWAAAEGMEAYEFVGEPEGYKRSFGAAPRRLRSIRVYPLTPAGATMLARDAGGKLRRWRPARRSGGGP